MAAGKPVQLIVGKGYNHYEMGETLGNPYAIMGRAALEMMKLANRLTDLLGSAQEDIGAGTPRKKHLFLPRKPNRGTLRPSHHRGQMCVHGGISLQ